MNRVGIKRWLMLVPILYIQVVHLSGERVDWVLMVPIRRRLAVDLLGMRRLLRWLVGLIGLNRLAVRHHAWDVWRWRWRRMCGIRVVYLI